MRLEHMRDEFPQMPDDIQKMIEDEVARQVKIRPISQNIDTDEENVRWEITKNVDIRTDKKQLKNPKSRKFSAKKVAVLFFAAALAVGTTAFAGSSLYKIYNEKVGNYGVATKIQVGENGSTYGKVPDELEVVNIVNNYIPDGMIQPEGDPGKMFYEDTPYQGGVSMISVTMNTKVSKDDVMIVDTDVKYSETLEISGHEAVYVEKNSWDTDRVWFDKKMYVIYPDEWRILEVFGGSDISKEEMLKVVENTELQPTGETYLVKDAVTWSEWVNPETVESDSDIVLAVSADEMADIYQIGEEFKLSYIFDEELEVPDYVTAKVTDVQVMDDLSLLEDSPYLDSDWAKEVGEDGKLLPNEIQYIKSGDGIDTTNEVIKTESVAQKLVYITVEYTNHSDEILENLMYSFSLAGIYETDGKYVIYDRAAFEAENSETDVEWDRIFYKGQKSFGEIGFYDLHGGERENNYISKMEPGETVTIHFAQIVNEDELEYMYLNLSDFSAGYSFTEEAFAQGYVDIRQ